MRFTRIYFLTISIAICNYLDAQNLAWEPPILSGNRSCAVDYDSSGFVYSFSTSSIWNPGASFFDTIAIPGSFDVGERSFIVKSDTNNHMHWMNVIESDFGIGSELMKISHNQKVLLAGSFWDRIKIDSIDISVPNHEETPFFIVQLDSDGRLLWMNLIQNKTYFTTLNDITFDSEDNINLIGTTTADISFGNLNSSGVFVPELTLTHQAYVNTSFIAKYAASGEFINAKLIPVTTDISTILPWVKLNSIAIDNVGNIFGTGSFYGKIATEDIMIESLRPSILLAKFNENLEIIWAKVLGPGHSDIMQQGQSIVFDNNQQNYYVTGNFFGSIDFGNGPVQSNDKNIFLAKYRINGTLNWVKNFGCWSGAASYTEKGLRIFIDDKDFVYLGGIYEEPLIIGDTTLDVHTYPKSDRINCDFFLAKFFANGDLSWAANAGCISSDNLGTIVKDNYNNVFVTGETYPYPNFGNFTLITPPNANRVGFLAKFKDRKEENKYDNEYGIEDYKEITEKIKVHPNPFINKIEFEIPYCKQSDIIIEISDINGQVLLSDLLIQGNLSQHYIYSFYNKPSGLYFLRIITSCNLYTCKLVKI
ncbi:MAG: T9SS type A sorting domain-containing protein [Bacteroidales bacterium]|nr:T9SS type A sorting domain-containing protein [Bacteroidales bacterium]